MLTLEGGVSDIGSFRISGMLGATLKFGVRGYSPEPEVLLNFERQPSRHNVFPNDSLLYTSPESEVKLKRCATHRDTKKHSRSQQLSERPRSAVGGEGCFQGMPSGLATAPLGPN